MTDLDAQDEIKAFLPELLLVRVVFIATQTLTETRAVLLMVSSITSHLHCSKYTWGTSGSKELEIQSVAEGPGGTCLKDAEDGCILVLLWSLNDDYVCWKARGLGYGWTLRVDEGAERSEHRLWGPCYSLGTMHLKP